MKLGIIGSGMIVKDFLSFAHELPEIKLEEIGRASCRERV